MIISLIILAIAAIFIMPLYELAHMLSWVGDLLFLAYALFVGHILCNLSDSDYGWLKMIFMACLFFGFVLGWGIIGFVIVIVIAMIW